MPVTGSGEIKLRADVNNEVEGNNTDGNVSLRALSEEAGKSVPDSLAEFYGYTSCTAPSMTTSPGTTSVADTSMVIRGQVSNNNGCDITSYGFYFGTSTTVGNNTQITVASSAINNSTTFQTTRSSLSASTTYYYWTWATNSAGTTISSMYTQATPAPSMPLTDNTTSGVAYPSLYGDTNKDAYGNDCANGIVSNLRFDMTNTSSSDFNQVLHNIYFNQTYGNSTNNAYGGSCGAQGGTNFDGNQNRTFTISFNSNAPAYSCQLCFNSPSYPFYTSWTAIRNKSGYASVTHSKAQMRITQL